MDDDLGAISWDNDRKVNYLSTTKLDIGIATFEFVLDLSILSMELSELEFRFLK